MPLLDHFHPPLSVECPYEGVHGAWAGIIATQLNDYLPSEYRAIPLITVGGRVEVDVGTFHRESVSNGGVATATWAPPRAELSGSLDTTIAEGCSIQVLQDFGGLKLRATIELVSPANKDRPSHRRAFAIKCANYLQQGVSVIIVDIVTTRSANLHSHLVEMLGLTGEMDWRSTSGLYATGYRIDNTGEAPRIEAWPVTLNVGEELPILPLWLDYDLCLPLDLEKSYWAACRGLRIAG